MPLSVSGADQARGLRAVPRAVFFAAAGKGGRVARRDRPRRRSRPGRSRRRRGRRRRWRSPRRRSCRSRAAGCRRCHALQVGVVEANAGVEHGDDHLRPAGRHGPCGLGIDRRLHRAAPARADTTGRPPARGWPAVRRRTRRRSARRGGAAAGRSRPIRHRCRLPAAARAAAELMPLANITWVRSDTWPPPRRPKPRRRPSTPARSAPSWAAFSARLPAASAWRRASGASALKVTMTRAWSCRAGAAASGACRGRSGDSRAARENGRRRRGASASVAPGVAANSARTMVRAGAEAPHLERHSAGGGLRRSRAPSPAPCRSSPTRCRTRPPP